MKKRITSMLTAAVMAVSMSGVMSISAENGSDFTYTENGGNLTITGYTGSLTELEIPEEIDSKPVTAIGNSAFEGNTAITSVIIPEGVTKIGYKSFYQCTNLESVEIPSTVQEFVNVAVSGNSSIGAIYNYAFSECTSLKTLTLSEGISQIGGYTFTGCTALESVTIPSTIREWGHCSFDGCTSLKDITIQEGVTVIGSAAFRGSAVESIVIPSTIEQWINIPKVNIGSYDGYAFADCKNLSTVIFADGLKKIGMKAFENCTSLKKVIIPASVTSMAYAFYNCTGLEEAAVADGSELTEFGNSAFYGCSNLKTLEVPATISMIESVTKPWFGGETNSLETIYLYGKDFNRYIPIPNSTVKFYCYFDSTTHESLKTNNIASNRICDITEVISSALAELNSAVDKANKLDESKYTADSYSALKVLLEKANDYTENSHILGIKAIASDIENAINALEEIPTEPAPTEPEPDQTKPDSSKPTTKTPTTAKPTTEVTVTTRSPQAVAKDKAAAEKIMKQAKIKKLTVGSKAKKITVTWKKVKKAVGYEVEVNTNKKFKKSKSVLTKTTAKKKLIIKNKKLKSGKKYFVRVRAYAAYKDANGTAVKVYSSWNKKLRKVTVK